MPSPIIATFFPAPIRRTLPLPAKIRTKLLDRIHVDHDPERVDDRDYVESIDREVESAIQDAMNRLAKQRRFPIFA